MAATTFPCQLEKPFGCKVFEPTDADVGILFDCGAGVRPQAVSCHISAEAPYIRLCGQLLCRNRFSRSQLSRLFWAARSKIVALQSDQSIHRGSQGSCSAAQLHYEVSSFLSFIRHEVERVVSSASSSMTDWTPCRDADWLGPRELCHCIADELRLTLRLVGRFSDLPAERSHCRFSDNRRFHIALETWWTAFQVADVMTSSHLLRGLEISFCDLGGFGQNGLLAQVAVLFLSDLCCLSSRLFQSRSGAPQESGGAFPCSCVRDAWAMVAEVIGRRHDHAAEETFWSYVNFVLEVVCPKSDRNLEIDLGGFCLSSFSANVEGAGQAAYCLWMLSAIAEATRDTAWGVKSKSNYAAAQRFVTAVTAEPKESLMRAVVRSCLSLHRVWEPSLDLLQLLLDFFLKNLNESFLTGSCGIQAFQVVCQTSQQMQVRARTLASVDDPVPRGAENSYELFLVLLAQSLHRHSLEGTASAWKSLRGRICSRFHAKRVEELTELGLQNCSLLFLVLALSVNLEEPVDRLLSVLALVPAESSVEKLRVALRSLFAVLLLLQGSAADLTKVAQRTASWFFERCVALGSQCGTTTCQSLRSSLLPVYTEGIREVMDSSSQLNYSEHVLLVPETALLLDQCSISQQEDVLGTIHEAAEKLRSVHKRVLSQSLEMTENDRRLLAQHKGFSEAIFKSTLQFLHKVLAMPVQAPPPPTCFTDLAANITLLSLDLPSAQAVPVKANFASLFEHFGCSPHMHPSSSGRFLCLVLEDDQAFSEIEARVTNSEVRLIQSWLRCCIGVEPPCSEMTRLSRIVLRRKEFAHYNDLVAGSPPSDEVATHDDFAVHFLGCLAQYADIVAAMDGISSLSQLKQTVALYLRDFVTVAMAQLRNSATASATRSSLGNVYHLCGQLFQLCAGLIYTRGMADCVLPHLLDSLILPSALYVGKPIPQAQLAAIKQHLPLFLCGLLSLSPKTDAYIERKLKDVVVHYLPLFPSQTQSSIHHTGDHPLLATLERYGGACQAAAQRRAAYVGFLLDFIHKHFVSKKSVSSTHLNQALRFLLELSKRLTPLRNECASILQSAVLSLLKSLGPLSNDARTNRELVSQATRALTALCTGAARPM